MTGGYRSWATTFLALGNRDIRSQVLLLHQPGPQLWHLSQWLATDASQIRGPYKAVPDRALSLVLLSLR
jgi:hypothetical protein